MKRFYKENNFEQSAIPCKPLELERKLRFQTHAIEINNLKSEVGEIKELLHGILGKLNG